MKNTKDAALLNLLPEWRAARSAANRASLRADASPSPAADAARKAATKTLLQVERAICGARAATGPGLSVQIFLLCALVEEGDIDAKLIRLVRNMRQAALAHVRAKGVSRG